MTQGCGKVHLEPVGTELHRKSFSFKTAQEWNSLPVELREIRSAVVFKRCLKSLFLFLALL